MDQKQIELAMITSDDGLGPPSTARAKTYGDEELPGVTDTDEVQSTNYLDVMTESKNFLLLRPDESLIDALQRMNPDLVHKGARDANNLCCTGTTILAGQIGCCTNYGQTYFLPPGNYGRLGVGVMHQDTRQVEDPNRNGTVFNWKDITYINLPENNVAVVQQGDRQLVVGSGRYIMRHPTTLYGTVDVQSLHNKEKEWAITEVAGEKKHGGHPRDAEDVQKRIQIPSGEYQKVGAITFVRSQPGFCYVIQDPLGNLKSGIGFYVCRGGEVFKKFVDRQHYARTTRQFFLESKDRQEVRVRVQLRWRLENAKKWMQRKGASEDIFDAIEEVAQSFLRDAVAAHSYEECLQQAADGYEDIEVRVRGGLNQQTADLGGRLLGFEIRELRFPLLELRNQERAQKEALLKEKLLEGQRQLDIETQDRKRKEAQEAFDMSQIEVKVAHQKRMEMLRSEEATMRQEAEGKLELTKQKATEQLESARTKALIDRENEKLLASQEADKIAIATEKLKAEGEAARRIIEKKSLAEEKVQIAQAEAAAMLAVAEAKSQSKIKMAEADAKAAELIGAAYRANPDYVKLELAKINADIMKARAMAISTAMTQNKSAMMPEHIQREMAFLDADMSPMVPVMLQNGNMVSEKKH